jgi:hypothetical protein
MDENLPVDGVAVLAEGGSAVRCKVGTWTVTAISRTGATDADWNI